MSEDARATRRLSDFSDAERRFVATAPHECRGPVVRTAFADAKGAEPGDVA